MGSYGLKESCIGLDPDPPGDGAILDASLCDAAFLQNSLTTC